MTSSHSAKISQVVSAVAGVAGAAAGIALAPIVTPALLSIVGVKAATGKLPPQVDQPARYHLTPREPLGTLAVGKVALGGLAHNIAANAVVHPFVTASVASVGAVTGATAARSDRSGTTVSERPSAMRSTSLLVFYFSTSWRKITTFSLFSRRTSGNDGQHLAAPAWRPRCAVFSTLFFILLIS